MRRAFGLAALAVAAAPRSLLIHPDKCELDLAEAASKALNATYDSFDSDLAGAV